MSGSLCPTARRLARQARRTRREVLQVGAAAALGLTTADWLLLREAGAAAPVERSCIVLWLSGGPSQLDTFDPKPEAPAEIRGPYAPLATNVPGIRVTELFPRLARQADRYALVRSVYHALDDHSRSMCWLLAGRLHDSIRYPNMGSVVARLQGSRAGMPPFVTVPRLNLVAGVSESDHAQTAGDMGSAWNPLIPEGVPGLEGFGIADLDLPAGVTPARLERRARLLEAQPGRVSAGEEGLLDRALGLVRSDRIRSAFDLESEPAALRDRYGRHGFGQSTLLARRLVERGVRFVTVNWPNYYQWDHHLEFAGRMKYQAPVLDFALSALLDDLQQRGLLDSTLVLCMGEFGRTPKINERGGRDHWVHAMTVLLAGGGIRGGQVVGSTDEHAAYPKERPLHARDVVATANHCLRLDPRAELYTRDGRPFPVLAEGEPITELTA